MFLDGSNFYHRLKDTELKFKHVLYFNYKNFAEWLANGRKIIECIYYVGLVRKEPKNKKSEALVRNQQKLFAHLKKHRWKIQTGYMLKQGKDYKEKGVDVKLALDIAIKAFKNEYDTAIIISSDTDLLPAIINAKELGKKIEYIGFGHKPSFGMQNHADISRLLIKSELVKFCEN